MRLEINGTVFDTEQAKRKWDEASFHDGRNRISKATGSQWTHETLYLSKKGRYYIIWESCWQGVLPSAQMVSRSGAAKWLLPEDLEDLEEVSE
jgi:hypothetical protein